MAGEIVGAAIGAGGSIINAFLQARENRINREYNKPINQMARLKEAGLNPHLVYGSGANATQQSQQAPQVDTQAIPQAMLAFQNLAIKAVEKDRIEAQVKLLETQEKLARENILNRRQATESAALKYSLDSGLFATNMEFRKAQLEGRSLQNQGIQIANANNITKGETMRLLQAPTLEKLIEDTLLTKARRSLIPYQKDLLQEQAKNVSSSTALNEVKRLAQEKQNAIFNDTHTLLLKNIAVREGQISLMQANEDLQKIRARWMDMGLSPTATQDLIETITGKKLLDAIGGKKKMSQAEQDADWMRRGRERFEEIRRANQNKK